MTNFSVSLLSAEMEDVTYITEKDIKGQHVENTSQVPLDVKTVDIQDAKRTKVMSVALSDAVAKDSLSPWSPRMIQLYGIMALITLSNVLWSVLFLLECHTNAEKTMSCPVSTAP